MISSNLQSQLFSKVATWDILTSNKLVWGHRSPTRIAQLEVEVWSKCVYVHLPANPISKVSPQGISRFISMWDYLDWFMMRSLSKANDIQARLVGPSIWEVEGSQRASPLRGSQKSKGKRQKEAKNIRINLLSFEF